MGFGHLINQDDHNNIDQFFANKLVEYSSEQQRATLHGGY
jgi:hypothetical protein